MRESEAVASARVALGARLAAYRRAVGHSQAEFASLIAYSRSSIANVEIGRQHVPGAFWTSADEVLGTGGVLAQANDEIEAVAGRERAEAACQAGPFLLAQARSDGALPAPPMIHVPGSAADASGPHDGWPDVISAAASDAREHAENAAVTGIGPGTVEQLTADVVRLGRAYVSAPPLPLFAGMHQALSRIQAALGQKAYPAQARDLNFLAGALCGLMANASLDLGREDAADDLGRAAWTYGQIIDHGPLMGWARGTQALAALWDHRYLDALQHIEDGLIHAPAGMGTVRLHAIRARALAAQGDHAQAAAAIAAAAMARTSAHPDDLHAGVAGEFAFDDAKLCYYEALTLADDRDPARAERAAATAIRLYQSVPARTRSYGCEALARVQLARAQLMSKKLGGQLKRLAVSSRSTRSCASAA
ncbi:MAG TPA: helix-turn-helix transcriptional regulator [Streptosporangiaceae bacterium]|nr:helix-turn-helix transcriptional regulator [Streptosporangiaceae bacterium]